VLGSYTRDFDRWVKGALELCKGNLEERLTCWRPWRVNRKGSGDGHLFPQGPCRETWKGALLPGALIDRLKGF
jgi:hypothetical protein